LLWPSDAQTTVFVGFVELIYLSYVKKKIQESKLFEKWTLQGLLDELDVIELFESPEHGRLLGEVTKNLKSRDFIPIQGKLSTWLHTISSVSL
jgi:hypothetical protein